MKILAVIPSRYASTRLPAKPLALINGKPLLAHVYDGVKNCPMLDRVIIATDDERIMELSNKIGAEAMMTSKEHRTGTDRIVEVVKKLPDFDVILNVQGDQPDVDPSIIQSLCQPFKQNKNLAMSTLKKEILKSDDLNNPNVVKVVTDLNNFALYFSRSLIPFQRDTHVKKYQHIGLYGFSRSFLLEFGTLKQTPLEMSESLEQLRALENGIKIYVNEIDKDLREVNTKEDISVIEKLT